MGENLLGRQTAINPTMEKTVVETGRRPTGGSTSRRREVMKWNKELPTKPGWYWWTSPDGGEKEVMNIFYSEPTQGLRAYSVSIPASQPLESLGGSMWIGPIEEPSGV